MLDAEVELQRALGVEPGEPKRSHMRVTAPDGVFFRFLSFEARGGRKEAAELGPFAVVVIGKDALEADGQPIATRTTDGPPEWQVGPARGLDVAFRTSTTAYHPRVAGALALTGMAPAAATPLLRAPPPEVLPR